MTILSKSLEYVYNMWTPYVTIFLVSKYIHHGCRFNLIPRNMLVPTYYESNAQLNRKKIY